MDLRKYINEIIDISIANGMSWDIGADMFLANIRNAGDDSLPYYKGAFVDYAALKAELETMEAWQIDTMKREFAEWVREHTDEISEARFGK